ncbi:type II CRISPR RNA-guided endonuclease Cas9 [Marinoscillum furvescens]|uniref:CRISPR-associated endonuclease Cas9 n=1 Tax=Marinoscillum furvescens DSM 4134 TaxID=1122208 RepID=A0A3D9KXW7_MARFU|nr:type II CRISPR RNA-guided endonuclease Cas9 [Marinoscillum furvescens]RED94091.1 CRISPR-associated endonuclease Csn1 [Marinoscillum furvescens DSM 4134]
MKTKKILGLDIGTNSIGWALIDHNFDQKEGKILGLGSRIIPMTKEQMGDFDSGNTISQTAQRTQFRSVRRLRERHLLRRERLHRVLHVLDWLPLHYARHIDFDQRPGQFIAHAEPKLPYNADGQFIFSDSFDEMLEDFKKHQPQILNRKNRNGQPAKVPQDWTLYYLRKKALRQAITKEELAWIVLNFNQKRGYYQLRGEEEEETPNKTVEFHSLRISEVQMDSEPNRKGEVWHSIILENGWVYRRSSKTPLTQWEGTTRDFIVTTDLNPDGTVKTDKEGNEKRSFRSPQEDDWTLIKKKTEQHIGQSGKTVGEYIYDALLQQPNQKIRGKLVRTIERKFYKQELQQILKKQMEVQPEFFAPEKYQECLLELYPYNEAHRSELAKKDLKHLIIQDIIFYQRPLRSQKSSISDCKLESRRYQVKDENGQLVWRSKPLKAIPKSHPLYQEFRVWQWLQNLKIYTKEGDKDITQELIPSQEDRVKLFDHLMTLSEINHVKLFEYFYGSSRGKDCKEALAKYRWNYVFDDAQAKEADKSKSYPLNETRSAIVKRLEVVEGIPERFLIAETEYQLWHIIYSVTDRMEYAKALESFASKYNEKHGTDIDTASFREAFIKFPPFPSDYGTFSEKAIKKLLPLMRAGAHWSADAMDTKTKQRIENIINGEADDTIRTLIREKTEANSLTELDHFQGLPLWLAQYVVYNRHAESALVTHWKSIDDLESYLKEFKQHTLRNPIVEQVMTETLRVVRDIWMHYGAGAANYFDEIHVELGREMKNPAQERQRLTNTVKANEATNQRIRLLIAELKNNTDGKLPVENVRPHSPKQQEALKIYEEGVLASQNDIPDDIAKISKTALPKLSELQRYKLWLEQKYQSPYTGRVIPLSLLFTEAYEIEHIIPQSRYFDDSLGNKVLCEAEVNALKDNQLGREFIKNHSGSKVDKEITVFTNDQYVDFVNNHYSQNKGKLNKLLMEEIPDKMIERQMNDTRYISKFVSTVLSNIVRDEHKDEGVNSKNLIPCTGKITSRLKQDWGLNIVWNELILPRFERMNAISGTNAFTSENTWGKTIPTVPVEYAKGFSKKRIDHRHHALDALVVACTSRDHVNLLNNKHAKSKERHDLNRKLRVYELINYMKTDAKGPVSREVPKNFIKPWDTLTQDAKSALETLVVSFKQNLRVINKTTNYYQTYKDENGELRLTPEGKPKKGKVKQTKGDSWAIRKSMHTPLPYAKRQYVFQVLELTELGKKEFLDDQEIRVKLEEIIERFDGRIGEAKKFLKKNPILNKNGLEITHGIFKLPEIRYRKRQPISILSNRGQGGVKTRKAVLKLIYKIGDLQLMQDLLSHLENNDDDINQAFSVEGLERFNADRAIKVNSLPITEASESKFPLGSRPNTKVKFAQADSGTNLFFAVYQGKNGKRSYATVPLNEVIERLKQGMKPVPEQSEKGEPLLFHLTPNDLVYVPLPEEDSLPDFSNLSREQANRIYKMVSSTGRECHFVNARIASPIKSYDAQSSFGEMGSLNKLETTLDSDSLRIKDECIKLSVNRLGQIAPKLD